MNNIEYSQLILASQKYNNIAVPIKIFLDIIQCVENSYDSIIFSAVTERRKLQDGLYGHINKCNVYVSGRRWPTPDNCIRVSNSANYGIYDIPWSEPLELVNLDKLIKLNAFW